MILPATRENECSVPNLPWTSRQNKIGSNEVLNFYIDGNEPSYIDIPIWYTHNLKNIGDEILYTNFWINEVFIQNDADTYFEDV